MTLAPWYGPSAGDTKFCFGIGHKTKKTRSHRCERAFLSVFVKTDQTRLTPIFFTLDFQTLPSLPPTQPGAFAGAASSLRQPSKQ